MLCPLGVKSMCGRAIATARSSLIRAPPRSRTRDSTSPIATSATMNATRLHVTRRSRSTRLGRDAVSPEVDPEAKCKVSREVGQEGELDPPELVPPVHFLLAGLDPGQVDRDPPRQEQHHRIDPENQEDQHAGPSL